MFVFGLCCLVFFPYLLRPSLIGADSYAFANVACHQTVVLNTPALALIVFGALPCNFLVFKLLLFVCFAVSTLLVAKLGMLYSKNGWLAGVLIFLSPYWIKYFTHFEDDQLAMPFLILALYFFFKGKQENKIFPQAIAVGIVCLTTLLIWNGGILFLFGLAMTSVIGFSIAYPLLVLNVRKLFLTLKPLHSAGNVLENIPIIGFYFLYLLIIGFRGLPTAFIPMVWLFSMFTLLQAKWHIFLMPLLAVGSVRVFETLDKRRKVFLIVLLVVLTGSFMLAGIFVQQPHPSNYEGVRFGVEKAVDLNVPVFNDWSWGHIVEYFGAEPSAKAGVTPQTLGRLAGIVITDKSLDSVNSFHSTSCRLLRGFRDLNVFNCVAVE